MLLTKFYSTIVWAITANSTDNRKSQNVEETVLCCGTCPRVCFIGGLWGKWTEATEEERTQRAKYKSLKIQFIQWFITKGFWQGDNFLKI
jgi:hypothetical protein